MTMPLPPNLPGMTSAPLLGHREQQAKAGIMQAAQQLSLGIYSQLAATYIGSRDECEAVEPERLRQIAKDSHAAAQAYFEGLGIVQFEGS